MLKDVIGERTSHRVLQEHFVGLEALPIHGLNLGRIEIHGKHANCEQYGENHEEERNARGNWECEWQKSNPVGPPAGGHQSVLDSFYVGDGERTQVLKVQLTVTQVTEGRSRRGGCLVFSNVSFGRSISRARARFDTERPGVDLDL